MLDQFEQLIAALLTQDIADECTQSVHVVAQGLMLRRKMYFAAVHDEPGIITVRDRSRSSREKHGFRALQLLRLPVDDHYVPIP